MFANRLMAVILSAVALSAAGCTAVENSSDRARVVAADVGERVEYHAEKVKRKTRSVWHWLFGDEESSASRKTKPKPEPAGPTNTLPNYPQHYVGKET